MSGGLLFGSGQENPNHMPSTVRSPGALDKLCVSGSHRDSVVSYWHVSAKSAALGQQAGLPGMTYEMAVHGATELRVFTVVAFCAAWNGGGVL